MFSNRTGGKAIANTKVMNLLEELVTSERQSIGEEEHKIKEKRRMHHSLSVSASKRQQFMNRPRFNNKTKEGELIDGDVKCVPYRFIPGYKNNTFIMPDRVFEKGNAAKRFFIKMKDTSVYSFREKQDSKINEVLHKDQKQKTIISRQVEEYDRVVNTADGKRKNEHNKYYLRNRKIFNPTNTFSCFSECPPMLEPKQPETRQIKKVSLAKSYDYRNKWRPVTRGTETFCASASNSFYNGSQYPASVF